MPLYYKYLTPEMVYDDCQVKLEKATVKGYETIVLTPSIGGYTCGGTTQS